MPIPEQVHDNALSRTRTATLIALLASGLVFVGLAAGIRMRTEHGFTFAGIAWLTQVISGFIAFGRGTAGAARRRGLRLGVQMAETIALRRWAIGGLIVALLGILGGVFVLGIITLALGSLGGAWGRPLRAGRKSVSAQLGPGHRWASGPRPRVDDLDATTRKALGLMWLHDAKKEHGSVPAFAQVTWQLSVVGAPSELLERCQRAAIEEIDHARRCFAVAEAYLDREYCVGEIDEVPSRIGGSRSRLRTLVRIAVESLEDGCHIEDLNADFAERARELATDPAMVELTDCIAREERSHAQLAWDILQWCVAQDVRVARAVRRAIGRIPTRVLAPYDVGVVAVIVEADPQGLRAHGRVPFEEWDGLHAARRERTVERAEALLRRVEAERGTVARSAA